MSSLGKVMVIGVGGLGSEILKILLQSNCNITVIDFDTVSTSNLSRQFFFTKHDEKKLKAQVIGEKLKCEYKTIKIQDFQVDFLDTFDVVFSCVDSVSARMEINYMFSQSKCKMLIDAGVEGLKAHAKRVTYKDSCLYCIKSLYFVNNMLNMCSLKGDKSVVNEGNRSGVIKSLLLLNKEKFDDENQLYLSVLTEFNLLPGVYKKAEYSEIRDVDKDIVPNICTINSIAASFAISLLDSRHDFMFVNCEDLCQIQKLKLEKCDECFVCKNSFKCNKA